MLLRLQQPDQGVDLAAQLAKNQVMATLLGEPQPPLCLGRFQLLRSLGQGGYGAVYEAREQGSESSVALKCLHAAGALPRAALQREFRAAQRLVHPNLVTLHELFTSEERPFFTMELVHGRGLLAQLSAMRADEQAIGAAFRALLDALATIHAAHKVHRDLKPSNVLLTSEGRVVVLDYGLMVDDQAVLDGARTGASGTRSYMAPEQAMGSAIGAKADLYAVGKMLCEALDARAERSRRGERSAALRSLARQLRDRDPARRPSAEQALAQWQSGSARSAVKDRTKRASREPFVGRQSELAALHAGLARARAGAAGLIWLRGESGMGKSSLLREFTRQAHEAGALVLSGRCFERENSPFKVFEGVVAGLARRLEVAAARTCCALSVDQRHALAQLFPELARALAVSAPESAAHGCDPSATQSLASVALHVILAGLAREQPVLIAVDDLQWGDADSARLLLNLFVPTLPAGVLFVGAYRGSESESNPFLRRVLGPVRAALAEGAPAELTLNGLSEAEVEALASALHEGRRALSASARSALLAAHGMPFLLCELLSDRALDDTCEQNLETRVLDRARACSPRARQLLQILCIAGKPLSPAIAASAAELDGGIWPSANELCVRRLARWRETDEGRDLEPYHDIVRTLIAEPGPHRAVLHRRLAEAIDMLSKHDVELSLAHWLQAGDDAQARACALRAARTARASMAWTRAAELYRLALELTTSDEAQRAELNEALATVLMYAGEHAAAGEAYERAAVGAQRAAARELKRSAATQLLLGGQVERGTALIDEALVASGISLPRRPVAMAAAWLRERARFALRLPASSVADRDALGTASASERCLSLRAAYRGITVHDPARGELLHARYLVETRGRRDAHELEALAWEAARLAIVAGPRASRAVARLRDQVRAIARGAQAPYLTAICALLEASYLLHCRERPRDALVWLARAEALITTCPGTHFEHGWLNMLRDYAVLTASELNLHDYWRVRERESERRNDAYTPRQLLIMVPLLRLLEDRPAVALEFLARSWPGNQPRDIFELIAFSSRLDVLHYTNEAAAAYALVDANSRRPTIRFAPRSLRRHFAYLRTRSAVALYAQTRDPGLAREARRCARIHASLPRLTQGLFRALLGSLAISDGDEARARRLLKAACADLVHVQHDNLAWLVRYRLAQLDADASAFARCVAWLEARGVRDAERWVSVLLPVKPARRFPD